MTQASERRTDGAAGLRATGLLVGDHGFRGGEGLAAGTAVAQGLPVVPVEASRAAGSGAAWLERSWWTAAGVVLLLWSFRLLGSVTVFPWLAGAVLVVGVWGLATILGSWLPRGRGVHASGSTALAWATVLVAVGALVVWSFLQIYQAPGYGTDEIAFDQYAAHLLLTGVNPYAHSMAPAFPLFHVQPNGYTFHLNGTPVTTLSYPALAFLFYAPLLALGLSAQVAVGLNVVAWGIAILATFAALPRALRPMAIVIGSLSVYIGYAVGGVTDALFVPLLVGAAVGWSRFGLRRGPRAWVGPVLMGLAMAVKQTPWLILPFVLVGVVAEARPVIGWARSLRAGVRYLIIAVVAFLVPNAAFIAQGWGSWLHGVLDPLLSHNVPAGQGLVALSLYLHLGGGSLSAYSLLEVVVLLAALAVFAATYPALRGWAFILPSVVLIFATRSYGSYLVDLVPAALVAAVTVHGTSRLSPWRRWPWVLGVGSAACAGAVAFALYVPSPLSVSITSVRTTGQLATVEQVGVSVKNRSSDALRPHFTLNSGDAVTSFWLTEGGPSVLEPGQRATYTLLSPNFYAQPPITGGFQVVAFTGTPAAVSHSSSYLPTTYHVALVPDAIDKVIPVGRAVTVKAEVLDRLNRPVHMGGIPVYLGQIIYAQRGLVYGEAIINSGQRGQTPVSARTNSQGVATFTIRGTQASSDPVYFEANLVNGKHYYPYGYSQILPIRFGGIASGSGAA